MSADDNLYDLIQIELPGIDLFAERAGGSPDADLLNGLRIASPCDASWEEMEGDDLVRFCRHCQKNVYNLSQMSGRAAARFVREAEDSLCVRFYRRRDGTLITDDCPVGWRAVRRRVLQSLGGTLATAFGMAWLLAPVIRRPAEMGAPRPVSDSSEVFMGRRQVTPAWPVPFEAETESVASHAAPTRPHRRHRRRGRRRRKS